MKHTNIHAAAFRLLKYASYIPCGCAKETPLTPCLGRDHCAQADFKESARWLRAALRKRRGKR